MPSVECVSERCPVGFEHSPEAKSKGETFVIRGRGNTASVAKRKEHGKPCKVREKGLGLR